MKEDRTSSATVSLSSHNSVDEASVGTGEFFLSFSFKINGDEFLAHWINLVGVVFVISKELFWSYKFKILVRLVGSCRETPDNAYIFWFLIEIWFAVISNSNDV